jgi:hypothetical protein
MVIIYINSTPITSKTCLPDKADSISKPTLVSCVVTSGLIPWLYLSLLGKKEE